MREASEEGLKLFCQLCAGIEYQAIFVFPDKLRKAAEKRRIGVYAEKKGKERTSQNPMRKRAAHTQTYLPLSWVDRAQTSWNADRFPSQLNLFEGQDVNDKAKLKSGTKTDRAEADNPPLRATDSGTVPISMIPGPPTCSLRPCTSPSRGPSL